MEKCLWQISVARCSIEVRILEGTGNGRLERAKTNIWSWEQEDLEFDLALLLVDHVTDDLFCEGGA